ncbi:MAG: cysteine synthase A [Euryarchaeota archaeon]|nr:cysteine synthase A [Euryarchaeota archaeon]|tara:strand:- start:5939 stop:6817 length:879 start_codon:yes stop_codon:yes gene_type:complete
MTRPSDHVGNTPLLQVSENLYGKFETYSPSGSVKDRLAKYILDDAELKGEISQGDTLIEATSGNTGIAFALLAAERGYNIKIVMPCNMSEERKQMMTTLGAELIEVGPGAFDEAIALRDQLAEKNGWYNTNQFGNPLNIECHYQTTGEEIVQACKSMNTEPAAFVSGTGTGGTIMGVAKKLREHYPNVKIIAVEPAESPVMSGGEPGLHGIQGIGDGSKFLVDLKEIDEIIVIPTESAKQRARELIKQNGMLVGISSGANVLACEKWISDNDFEGTVFTMLCDRGERYLSCI